jgi:hypothetical protein
VKTEWGKEIYFTVISTWSQENKSVFITRTKLLRQANYKKAVYLHKILKIQWSSPCIISSLVRALLVVSYHGLLKQQTWESGVTQSLLKVCTHWPTDLPLSHSSYTFYLISTSPRGGPNFQHTHNISYQYLIFYII